MADRSKSYAPSHDELDLRPSSDSRRKSSIHNNIAQDEEGGFADISILPPAEDEEGDSIDLRRLAFGGQEVTPKRPSFFQKTTRVQDIPHGNLEEIEGSRQKDGLEGNTAVSKRKKKSRGKDKSKKNRKGDKAKKKIKRTESVLGLINVLRELWNAGRQLMTNKEFCQSGLLYIATGLVFAFILEIFHEAPKYNVVMLTMLLAAEKFAFFPFKTMRPQLVISVLVAMSICVDIFHCYYTPPSDVRGGIIALTVMVMLSKCFCLWCFLHRAHGSGQARKYLVRRVRLFTIPLNEPRRIMKEVRARILAIGWIELIATVVYFTLFILSVTTMAHTYNFDTNGTGGMPIAAFALVKSFFAGAIAGYIAYDTDFVLCLWFFGCLGFFMPYVKNYIRRQREELGGWPLPYAFNEMRFQFLSALKVVDLIVGISGWVSIGPSLQTSKFNILASDVKAFLSSLTLMLVLTDIWCPGLFLAVSWLHNRFKVKQENDELEDSDDSELDELGIRSDNGSNQRKREKQSAAKKKRRATNERARRRRGRQDSDSRESPSRYSRGDSYSDGESSSGSSADDSESRSDGDGYGGSSEEEQADSRRKNYNPGRRRTKHHEDINVRFSANDDVDHGGDDEQPRDDDYVEEEDNSDADEYNIYGNKAQDTSRSRFGWSPFKRNKDADSGDRQRGMWSTSRAEAKTLAGEPPLHTDSDRRQQFSSTRGEGEVNLSAQARRQARRRGKHIPASKRDGADDDYYDNEEDDDNSEYEEGEWMGEHTPALPPSTGRTNRSGVKGLISAAASAAASENGGSVPVTPHSRTSTWSPGGFSLNRTGPHGQLSTSTDRPYRGAYSENERTYNSHGTPSKTHGQYDAVGDEAFSPLAGHRRSVSEGARLLSAVDTPEREVDEGLRARKPFMTPSKTSDESHGSYSPVHKTTGNSGSNGGFGAATSSPTGSYKADRAAENPQRRPSGTLVRLGRRASSGRENIFVGGIDSIVSEPPRGLLSIGAQAQAAAGDEGHAGQVMSPIGNKKSVADKDLVLDPGATIAPNAYSVLWEQLDVSVQFKTTIQPPPQPDGAAPRTEGEEQDDDDAAIMVDALCRHLSSRGFFVVASGGGHDNGISKLFAFASGYPLDFYSGAYNQEDRNPVYFLAEMKVEFHGGVGSFECKTKTTHKNFSAAFVSKFSLGSVISRA